MHNMLLQIKGRRELRGERRWWRRFGYGYCAGELGLAIYNFAIHNITLGIINIACLVIVSCCMQLSRYSERWLQNENRKRASSDYDPAYLGPQWARLTGKAAERAASGADEGANQGASSGLIFHGAKLFAYREWLIFGKEWLAPEDEGYLFPAGAGRGRWNTSTETATCRFEVEGDSVPHGKNNEAGVSGVVVASHICGLHGMWTFYLRTRRRQVNSVFGLVEAYGKVIPGDWGLRAQHMKIRTLFIRQWRSKKVVAQRYPDVIIYRSLLLFRLRNWRILRREGS